MCLAIPARIKKVEGSSAVADFGGVSRNISLGILSDTKVGDYVLVHAGFAIGKVSEQDAVDIYKSLNELKKAIEKRK